MTRRLCTLIVGGALLLAPFIATCAGGSADPSSVLIVVNDNTPPEAGTGGVNAGQYVADRYAAARGIPAGNIAHIRTTMACCDSNPKAWDSWNITWQEFSTGLDCILNDQTATGGMIASAPGALWAWGWYSFSTNDVYSFAPGAVGAQLTSYTAESIRYQKTGAWVPLWLERGITATWGATGEPYVNGYTVGDALLNRLWNGYTFGEAAYLATPKLNWKMVFVGDPLYLPRFID